MKNYIGGSLKILINYSVAFLLFLLFLPVGASHPNIYSFIMLFLALIIVYSDYNALALKERRPGNNIVHYPLKGFFMAACGFIPVAALVLTLRFIAAGGNTDGDKVIFGISKLILGPVLGLFTTNLLILLIFPLVGGGAYLAGFYGKEIPRLFKHKPRKKVVKQ